MNIKKELEIILEMVDTARMDIWHEYHDDDSYIDENLLEAMEKLEAVIMEVEK